MTAKRQPRSEAHAAPVVWLRRFFSGRFEPVDPIRAFVTGKELVTGDCDMNPALSPAAVPL
jgi:hypothetical protein